MRKTVKIWNWALKVDRSLLLWARQRERRWLTKWMISATKMGDSYIWVAVGLFTLGLGTPALHLFALLAISSISAPIMAQIIKRLCRRPRPSVAIEGFSPLIEMPDPHSFPSGHTTTAFAVAFALLTEGAFLGPLALLNATNVALSRIYLGAHYPLDVVAGAAIGTSIGLLARLIVLP